MPYIVNAVDSVLNQTFQDFELLIINDGSKDGTADFLNSLSDKRIRVIHQKNRGLCETLNRGCREASSLWIARLDQDDIALPNRLEKQYNFVLEHPEVATVFCSYRRIGESGKTFGVYSLKKDFVDDPMLHGYPPQSTMLCNKKALLMVGGYREEFYPVDDLDLALRLVEKFRLGVNEEPLIEYRFHLQSFTFKYFNILLTMRRYVRFCAVIRRKGMLEPSLLQFLKQEFELPFQKRLFRMMQDQGSIYRRLAISYMLGGRKFRGLYFLLLAIAMDPKENCKRVVLHFTGLFKRFKK